MRSLFLLSLFLMILSCGSSKKGSAMPQEKSDECLFQDEVCREAENFQREYYSMAEEERDQMTAVLNSYIEHCEIARKACKKSMR